MTKQDWGGICARIKVWRDYPQGLVVNMVEISHSINIRFQYPKTTHAVLISLYEKLNKTKTEWRA